MADAVNAYEATLVGDQLPGDQKWSGGVLAADGNIYGIPCDATQVLRLLTDKPPAATTADADHYVAIVQGARTVRLGDASTTSAFVLDGVLYATYLA